MDGIAAQKSLWSSASGNWETPPELFGDLNAIFQFTLDAAASKENAKCEAYFDEGANALARDWPGRVWLNPPYGREIGAWMEKAYRESKKGSLVVCLVPVRSDAGWWHEWATRGRVFLLKGRLQFGGAPTNAPFPSAIVIFFPGVLADAV